MGNLIEYPCLLSRKMWPPFVGECLVLLCLASICPVFVRCPTKKTVFLRDGEFVQILYCNLAKMFRQFANYYNLVQK